MGTLIIAQSRSRRFSEAIRKDKRSTARKGYRNKLDPE